MFLQEPYYYLIAFATHPDGRQMGSGVQISAEDLHYDPTDGKWSFVPENKSVHRENALDSLRTFSGASNVDIEGWKLEKRVDLWKTLTQDDIDSGNYPGQKVGDKTIETTVMRNWKVFADSEV